MNKPTLIFLTVLLLGQSALAQYYPQIRTRGKVAEGDVAVFADGSGRFVKKGSITATATNATLLTWGGTNQTALAISSNLTAAGATLDLSATNAARLATVDVIWATLEAGDYATAAQLAALTNSFLSLAWTNSLGALAYLNDAPGNTNFYGRRSNAWEVITLTSGTSSTNLSDYNNDVPFLTSLAGAIDTNAWHKDETVTAQMWGLVGGVYYAAPTDPGSANDILRNNGSGTTTWLTPPWWTSGQPGDGSALTGVVINVEYGTASDTAYRGDWGLAVSNRAAMALTNAAAFDAAGSAAAVGADATNSFLSASASNLYFRVDQSDFQVVSNGTPYFAGGVGVGANNQWADGIMLMGFGTTANYIDMQGGSISNAVFANAPWYNPAASNLPAALIDSPPWLTNITLSAGAGININTNSATSFTMSAATNLDSFTEGTTLASAPTVTVSRADGNVINIEAAHSPMMIELPSIPTNGSGVVLLNLVAGTNSISWSNANSYVSWATAPTLPTNGAAANPMILTRNWRLGVNTWTGRQ